MAEPDPQMERGIELFNRGQFHESHEALEAAWNRAPRAERFFLQSLVHCAVAWHHASRGNLAGAILQARRALRKLAGYLPAHAGLDTLRLQTRLSEWLEAWERGAAVRRATIGVRR